MESRTSYLPDVDIRDWDDVSPYQLFNNPALFSGKPIVKAAARALKYSRSGESDCYDAIGFRSSAATPVKGPVPLQTIAGMRMEKELEERKLIKPELDELIKQQPKLRHRPLELPSVERFRYHVTGNTMDFILTPESSAGDVEEDVWSFPLTTLPSIVLKQGTEDRDLPQLFTQSTRVDIPCDFWVPVTALIEAGQFKRMQDWKQKLCEKTAPGCFYCYVLHRWLSTTHPDPDGVHARFIAWQLFSHLCEAVRVAHIRGLDKPRKFSTFLGFAVGIQGSDLAESLLVNVLRPTMDSELIEEAANEITTIESLLEDYGAAASNDETALQNLHDILQSKPVLSRLMSRIFLWYDYSCLPQAPRSESEETFFRKSLEYLNTIQVLGRTIVLLDDVEDFMSRAWCTLEAIFADRLQAIDLMVGSQRVTARQELAERFFHEALEDRPHIVWRALLDTEVFGLQTSSECMTRLELKMTDEQDLPYIYQRLCKLGAPQKIHVDDSELLTGVFPLPVVDQGKSVLWTKHSGRSVAEDQEQKHLKTLDWTDALNLQTGWNPEEGDDEGIIPPSLQFEPETSHEPADEKRPRCHVAVIGSCEGEAVILSNWVRKHRGDLESLIDATVASLTWLASDIAPIGHFVYGKLTAEAVDADLWVVLTLSTRFGYCTSTGLLIDLLQHAGRRTIAFSVDKSTNNVLILAPEVKTTVSDDESERFMSIELTETGFPIHPGGLFRAAVIQHLFQVEA